MRWFFKHAFVLVPAQALVAQHLTSYQEFAPRQRPGSFTVERAPEQLRRNCLVETDGADGKLATFEAKYTFGVDNNTS